MILSESKLQWKIDILNARKNRCLQFPAKLTILVVLKQVPCEIIQLKVNTYSTEIIEMF